ncbi:MAG: hypothetical protein QXQ70_10275, partial [Candidatus Caldarchaeum sp.]
MKIARIRFGGREAYAIIANEGVYSRSYLSGVFGENLPATVAGFAEECVMNTVYKRRLEDVVSKHPTDATISEVSLLAPLDNRPKII